MRSSDELLEIMLSTPKRRSRCAEASDARIRQSRPKTTPRERMLKALELGARIKALRGEPQREQ